MKKKCFLTVCLIILLSAFSNVGAQSDDVKITLPHPRLLLLQSEEEQIKAKIQENEFLKDAHNHIIKQCNKMIDEPLLEHVLTGKRLLTISRQALERIYYLSYAWRMTGDDRYAERAEKEMINVSNFKDWNPQHFLDVAEMTLALSIGYDWLYSYISDSTKEIVRKAIIKKGINESMPETATDKENYSWLKKVNNWNQVCNTGMAFGAIATYESNPELSSKIISRSVKLVRDTGMHEYLPDGNYPEGYTYWSYGTSFNVMLIDALEKCLGTSFGMTDNKGFMNTGEYILNMTAQNLGCFAYSDCGDVVMSYPMFWLAKRTNNPDLIWGELQKYDYMKKNGILENAFSVRFLPSFLLWASPETMNNPQPPTKRLYVGQGTTPVAILRNHWGGANEIFVGLKGGTSSTNHAHIDVGSFVMYQGANQWAKDAGIQEYYSLEKYGLNLSSRTQNSSRWDAFRFGNKIHNIIVFSNSLQRVTAKAKIDGYGDTKDFVFAETDLTAVNEGLVKDYKRGVAIVENRYVVVRDEITNINKTNPIRWAMLTPASPKIIDKNTAELTLNGEKMIVKVVGKEVDLQTWSTEPPHVYDAPNPGTVLFGFTCKLNPSEKATISVFLIPEKEYKDINYQIPALYEWGNNDDKTLINKVVKWQIENINQVDTSSDLNWTKATLYRGMAEWAEFTQSESLYNHLYEIGKMNNWNMLPRVYDADDLCICQTYIKLFNKYKEPEIIEKCIARMDSVIVHPMTMPLNDAPKGKYNRDRWGWCDALFMAPPAYAQISLLKSNPKYLNFAVNEFKVTIDTLYNKEDHLIYRDLNWVGKMEESGKKMYWGRGNGWVFAGLAFMLQSIPKSDPNYSYFLNLYTQMSDAILACQDENGSWHTSLMDAASYPEPENSASGFFVYGLAWGINNGILKEAKYKDGAKKGWEALKKWVDENGKLGYVQPVGHAPYKNLSADMTYTYGVGAFLLAGAEICKM